MKALRTIAIALIVIVAVAAVGGYFLPSGITVSRFTTINAPKTEVFTVVNSLRTFSRWSPWTQRDPGIVFAFETDWNDSAGWISIMNITAFCLSIVGAIAAFRRFWRLMALVGPAFLVAASIVSLIDIGLFAVLLLVLGILSLVFMAIGYNEMTPAPWPGWSQGAAGMGYIPPGSAQQVSPFGGGDPGGRTGRS